MWKEILSDEEYRGHIILDSHSKTPRSSGQFFVLLVFFQTNKDKKLEGYLERGRKIKKVTNEILDKPEIQHFYGTMRMLQYS